MSKTKIFLHGVTVTLFLVGAVVGFANTSTFAGMGWLLAAVWCFTATLLEAECKGRS